MVRIPEEYQEVEYIESTGTQYIELSFGFLDTDEIKIIACELTKLSDKFIVAPLRWETARRFAMVGSYGNKFCVGFGAKSTSIAPYSPQQTSDTETHIWTYKNKIFSIIDLNAFYEWQEGSITQATANLRLFYGYNAPSKGRIYSYYHKKIDGTEINLIPCYRKSDNEIGMFDTVSKTFYINSGTGEFLKGHNVYYNDINLLEQRRKILLNTPHLKTIQNNIATFNTDIKIPLKECKIYFTPKQEGSGDPSPENIRPISGWNEINIYHTGKNFFPIESGMRGASANILLKANQIYTGSVKSPLTPYIRLTYIDDTLSSYIWLNPVDGSERSYKSFQPILDTKKVNFSLGGQMVQEMMVERGNVIPNSFESYRDETPINIPFSQPIYGGYVDLIKGEIVSEYCTFVLDGVNNYIARTASVTQYGMAIAYSMFNDNTYKGLENLPKGDTTDLSYIKSDKYIIPIRNNGGAASQEGIYFGGSNNNLYVRVAVSADKIPDTSTQANIRSGINAWLQENPVQITYKMAEPIIYSLTPQNITPFKGINNIFSDANGNVKIKFLAR